jgi:flagellar biosynthesis chaperone FliJ
MKALVRVAELKEAVARGQAGQALAAALEAHTRYDDRVADLRSAGLDGGAREALTSSATRQLLRADAAAQAQRDLEAARAEQAAAVAQWTDARRRHRLFNELAERAREDELTRRERVEQTLADELAASRARRR